MHLQNLPASNFNPEPHLLKGRIIQIQKPKMREKFSLFECGKCNQIQLRENDLMNEGEKGSINCLAGDSELDRVNSRVSRQNLGPKGGGQLCGSTRLKPRPDDSILWKFAEVHLEIPKSMIEIYDWVNLSFLYYLIYGDIKRELFKNWTLIKGDN